MFVSVSGPRDDSLPEQWEPRFVHVCNQLLDVHISEESHVESKWVTTHAPFRKHVRPELGTLLLRNYRQNLCCKRKKNMIKMRDGRDI